MTFYEKYPQLRDKVFLSKILVETVYTTMLLEDQEVPKERVKEIVMGVIKEKELKGQHFT